MTTLASLLAEAKALGAQKRAEQAATDAKIVAAFANSKLAPFITAPDPQTKLPSAEVKTPASPKHWQFTLIAGVFVEKQHSTAHECDRLCSHVCKACKLAFQRSDHRLLRVCDTTRVYACKTCKRGTTSPKATAAQC